VVILLIIGGIFLLALLYLLFAPFILEIDSPKDLYQVRFGAVATGELFFTESLPAIRMKVFGLQKILSPFEPKKKMVKEEKPAKEKKPRKISVQKMMRKGLNLFRSFKVTYFYLDLDTDDYVMNGLLYPIAARLSKPGRIVCINFESHVVTKLRIENTIGQMILAYIK
jgi:hypothetical protein